MKIWEEYLVNESSGIDDYGISRGAVKFDFDNDGDLDLFTLNRFSWDLNYVGEFKVKIV